MLHGAGTTAEQRNEIFFLKLSALLFFFIWVRWTYPRLRYDQLMHFGWKVLLPVSLANIVVTALWEYWRMQS